MICVLQVESVIKPAQVSQRLRLTKLLCMHIADFIFFPLTPPPSQNAMQIVGFMEDEMQSVLELVAAVLKLGNIEFKPESRCNGTDESRIKDKNGACVCVWK